MSQIAIRPPNKVDETILRLADSHSFEEISKRLGGIVSPASVGARLHFLLKSKNHLDQLEQMQLNEWKLKNLLVELEGKYHDDNNVKLQLQLIKEILKRLDARAAATDTDLNQLYANQGRIMSQAFDIALSYMKGALRDEINPEVWDEVREEALRHAEAELDSRTAIEG